MLYNRNWDKPKHKPLSMKAVIAWLKTKDPEEEYAYSNSKSCLAAQYNDFIGRKYNTRKSLSDNPATYFTFDRKLERLAHKATRDSYGYGVYGTFGRALELAER